MQVDVITIEDLRKFKTELLAEMKNIIKEDKNSGELSEWLRSAEVRKILKISAGTLQHLRVQGTISFRKVGGTLYYSKSQIEQILNPK